ncbi:MAG: hypothetical protein Q9O24_05830 [Gammaproteobacteria bacterium]|nr:hypothetical protein [Gammaproteobacteria bacterium]
MSYFFSTFALAETVSNFILPSGVGVEIVEVDFQRNNFTVTGCLSGNDACLINGRIPYGVGFDFPKTYVEKITVSFKDCSYGLNVTDMYNAWGDRQLEYPGVIRYFGGKCFDNKNCKFRGVFSDASVSFVVEWFVVNGVETRTVMTSSSDVVNLFKKNIDPPEFD